MPNILDAHLAIFEECCTSGLQTYFAAVSLFNENKADGFTEDMKYMIVENVFLNICSSWERFLESIFIAYMQGEQSENGVAAKTYVSPISEEHAYNLVKNVTLYPDWTDIGKVLTNAENFFENKGPFRLLQTLQGNINAAKKIRNAIAHASKKANEDFQNLVRGMIGHLPNDITPAKFLSDYKKEKKSKSPTFFEYYVNHLKESAKMLVEYHVDEGVV